MDVLESSLNQSKILLNILLACIKKNEFYLTHGITIGKLSNSEEKPRFWITLRLLMMFVNNFSRFFNQIVAITTVVLLSS